MSKSISQAAVNQDEPLPRCAGPKLHPFPDRSTNPNFIRLLSGRDPGEHSHVFEVAIGSKFRFYDPDEDKIGIFDDDNVTEEILEGHTEPFFAECRAFGQIQKHGLNGKVAVACYGFMGVPAYYESQLARRFDVSEWDRPGDECLKKSSERQPFRAIVKELIHGETGVTLQVVRKISRDLKQLRKIGVYPMDIRAPNFMAGRLLDFSVSRTEPHYLFQIRPDLMVRALKHQDLVMFDKMVRKEQINTRVRMMRNEEYCKKLRNPRRPRSRF